MTLSYVRHTTTGEMYILDDARGTLTGPLHHGEWQVDDTTARHPLDVTDPGHDSRTFDADTLDAWEPYQPDMVMLPPGASPIE